MWAGHFILMSLYLIVVDFKKLFYFMIVENWTEIII